MYIIDLTGARIEIRNLEQSIQLAESFMAERQFHGEASLNRLEQTRQDFWRDIRDKLLLLKNAALN